MFFMTFLLFNYLEFLLEGMGSKALIPSNLILFEKKIRNLKDL